MREFSVVIERDSGGVLCRIGPGYSRLPHAGEVADELTSRIREAIELNLEAAGEPIEPLEFVGVQRVSVAG